jgi:hypothetical protein
LPARAEDYTDIWWAGPTEDGWGVNLAQNQDVIFATFFVHGPAPSTAEIWYVATLDRTPGGLFTGDLYQTTGTGIGAPWNPAQKTATKVGTATFSPTSSTSGRLTYNVGTTMVAKDIIRQTLRSIALGGSYYGVGIVNTTGCAGSGQQVFDVDPVVAQNASELQIVLTFSSESCTLQGPFAQQGSLFRIPTATYVCTSGGSTTLNTTATVYEVKATSLGLEGRWSAPNVGGGCVEDGTFSAVFP